MIIDVVAVAKLMWRLRRELRDVIIDELERFSRTAGASEETIVAARPRTEMLADGLAICRDWPDSLYPAFEMGVCEGVAEAAAEGQTGAIH